MDYDVIIIGGGPAGLAAALTLGRARKRVLLCDSGPPRNAAAVHVQNFVTRDGIPPREFRRIAREQLAHYPAVQIRDARVDAIDGERGSFRVRLGGETVSALRVLLCTGMVDVLPGIDGFRELWGKAIFACPYCHGWEVQDRRFAYLATNVEALAFAIFLRGWTSDVVALTNAAFTVSDDMRARLRAANVDLDERRITRLQPHGDELQAVVFDTGDPLPRDVLFMHPEQQQVPIVRALGLTLDEKGFIRADATTRETSIPGIYAAGDITNAAQGASIAAGDGTFAAARLNHALTLELAAAL